MTINGQYSKTSSQSLRKKIQNYSYITQDRLGSGYSAEVFRGIDERSGKTVAVKVVHLGRIREKGLEELLSRQIKLLREVAHENVIRCHDVLMTANNCYIITEMCNGGDLGSMLQRKGRLQLDEALPLIQQISKGIAHLHANHILHRDIKPQNILLHCGIPKIADLGFAIKAEFPTKDRFIIGSPLYMSPEALLNKEYSQKGDIWALGVTMYEILEGRAPWNAKDQKQLKEAVKLQTRFRNVRNVQLQDIIKGCLSYEQQNRLTITDVVQRVEAIMGLTVTPCAKGLDKQNTERGNENNELGEGNEESQELKKAMRNNYNLLKWLINYSRFAAKLLPKIGQHLKCDQSVKQSFIELTARSLHLTISKLAKIEQVHSQLTLTNFQQFKKTSRFHKIQAVTSEYHQRYLLLLTKLPYKYHHPPSLALEFPKDVCSSVQAVDITIDCSYQHLLVIDFVLTLMLANHWAKNHQPMLLPQMINFQQIMQKAPQPYNQSRIQQLIEKRKTVLYLLNNSHPKHVSLPH